MASSSAMSASNPGTTDQAQFDNVSGSPGFISRSEVPAEAPQAEAIVHTGQINTIDVAFRQQFISLGNFEWNTNQPAGTTLFKRRISPHESHRYIDYLSKMYNVWIGGFDFQVFLNATNFHGGELIIWRCPPNLDPDEYNTLSDITVFSNQKIDPKNTTVFNYHVRDQRNRLYHYMDDTGRDSIGGYIVVSVYAPLITSSTGNQAITGCVLTKPSGDFDFLQLKPLPTAKVDECLDRDVDRLARTLSNLSDNNFLSNFNWNIHSFHVAPMSQAAPPASLVGCHRFDGTKLGAETDSDYPIAFAGRDSSLITTDNKDNAYVIYTPASGMPSGKAKGFVSAKSTTTYYTKDFTEYDGKVYIHSNASSGRDGYECVWLFDNYLEDDKHRKIPAKLAEESYVLFSNQQASVGAARTFQPSLFAHALKTEVFKNLITNRDCVIIDMVDVEQATPIRRLKVYHSGIITTTGSEKEIVYPAGKYTFKFVQYSKVTEPIPKAPSNYKIHDMYSQLTNTPYEQLKTILN